jgi:putative heme-binding domain-containing protein
MKPWADDAVIIATCRAAGAWKILQPSLKTMAADPAMSFAVRAAAASALGECGDKAALAAMKDRALAAIGLAAMDVKLGAPVAAEALSGEMSGGDPVLVVSAFTSRTGGADALAAALATKPVNGDAARRVMQDLNATGFQHAALRQALSGSASTAALDQRLMAEDPRKLAEDVMKLGDAGRGERVFRRATLVCMNCHAIAGGGPELGPDLASIGSSSPLEYIIDSVLQPSKVIKDQYENVVVVRKDGGVVAGILAFKDDAQVRVRDPTQRGREVSVPRSQVASITTGPSLMPPGLANMLKDRGEFLDLIRFLSELGRPGPYATPTLPIIRRWRVATVDAADPAVKDDAFTPAYSMTSGELPPDVWSGGKSIALVRGQFDVSSPGSVRMAVNAMSGVVAVWLDGKPVDVTRDVEVSAGVRTVTFVIDVKQRGAEGLKVQVEGAGAKAARVQVVGGA